MAPLDLIAEVKLISEDGMIRRLEVERMDDPTTAIIRRMQCRTPMWFRRGRSFVLIFAGLLPWQPACQQQDVDGSVRNLEVSVATGDPDVTLAVFGGADQQVTLDQNLDAFVEALIQAENQSFTVTVLPDEDHFFLGAEGLAPNEHVHGRMKVSEAVLQVVGDWLALHLDLN